MLTPPRNAQEAFGRLAPDLAEIEDFISNCPLTTPERKQLAKMLGDHYYRLAVSWELADVRVLRDVKAATR